jgi:hypothetical protein
MSINCSLKLYQRKDGDYVFIQIGNEDMISLVSEKISFDISQIFCIIADWQRELLDDVIAIDELMLIYWIGFISSVGQSEVEVLTKLVSPSSLLLLLYIL